MPCTGTYIGECCEPPVAQGAVSIALGARQAGFHPLSWPTLTRQFAAYRNHTFEFTNTQTGGRASGSARFPSNGDSNLPVITSFSQDANYYLPFPTSNQYVEGTITETSFALDWYYSFTPGVPKEFQLYSGSGTLSEPMPLSWERALDTLRGLSFEGIPVGNQRAWGLSISGVLTQGATLPTGVFAGALATDAAADGLFWDPVLPIYGAVADPFVPISPTAFIGGQHYVAYPFETITFASKALWVNAGFGREQRFHLVIDDASGRSRTRYYCAADLPRNQPIELFPDIAGSGVPAYYKLESAVNFYPISNPNACDLP